jgi:hypothetical protein
MTGSVRGALSNERPYRDTILSTQMLHLLRSPHGTNPKCRCAPPRSGDWGNRPASCNQAREFKETPKAKAFWRVAPSVLLSARAILPAGVFPRARVFSSRISVFVHSRRFEFFLAISFPIFDYCGRTTDFLELTLVGSKYNKVN